MRPACLGVGGNWLGCFFVSSIFVPFLSDVRLLCSSPCTRLGLVRACMIGGRGNGNMSSLYESSASTLQLIPPKIAYRFSACALSPITWRSPHDNFVRQETSRETRAQVRCSRLFPSSHQTVQSQSRLGHHLFMCLLPFLTFSSLQ